LLAVRSTAVSFSVLIHDNHAIGGSLREYDKVPPMSWNPHVTVAAVIERNGRFLIVEEVSNGQLVYNQPAGHLDEGESLITAAVRETLEETAWSFTPDALVGIYRWRNPGSNNTYLRVCFTGQCTTHDPNQTLDEGIVRALWLSRAELCASGRLRSPMVLRCIDDYLAGSRYPLSLLSDLDEI
jgi:8-oxo-dGTP pyrophosphatase MutT (NUDIX family)